MQRVRWAELELCKSGEIVELMLYIMGSHVLSGRKAVVALKYQVIVN